MGASSYCNQRRRCDLCACLGNGCVCGGHLVSPFGLNAWNFRGWLIVHPSWALFWAPFVQFWGLLLVVRCSQVLESDRASTAIGA